MTYEESIERINFLKNKAVIALNNNKSSCEWLKKDVAGTINAFSMAIEALEIETHNCEDCRHADFVLNTNTIYCLEHCCVMKTDNCCRDWSEEK